MKSVLIAAAAASVLAASAAAATPFPSSQTTVATQVSYQSIEYNISAGHTITKIDIPVTNRPVHLMVTCTTFDDRGVGSVTLIRATGGGQDFLQWVGSDYGSINAGTNVDFGFNNFPATHIMYADFDQDVDVQVDSVHAIRIVNKKASTVSVVVTMIY